MYNLIELQNIEDERGCLIIGEINKHVTFPINRFYFLSNLNNEPRGFHAHYECRQMMVCLQGTCNLILNNGVNKQKIVLSKKNEIVTIEPMVWHEMHDFSEDCILFVVASAPYNEDDYIRNYSQFKTEVENEYKK